MSGARGRRRRDKVVLVFGESEHDAKAIAALIEGLRPDLRGKVKPRREAIILKKSSGEKSLRSAERIARAIQQESCARDVLAVVKFEDCDAAEPADVEVRASIRRALAAIGYLVVPVAAAWELESWFFLFPDACLAVNAGWRRPADHLGKHVGVIVRAKEELQRRLRPEDADKRRRVRDYEEVDAPLIARAVGQLGLFGEPTRTSTRSDSFTDLVQAAHRLPSM